MVERKDTGATRHAGGWIVLGAGLLLVCLRSYASLVPASVAEITAPENVRALAGTRDAEVAAMRFPSLSIDINRASEAELSCVAGVGPALAGRIIEYRQRVGGFTSLDELDEIPGVGPKLAERLKQAVELAPLASAQAPAGARRPVPQASKPAASDPTPSEPAASDPTILVGQNLKSTTQHVNGTTERTTR